jgi:two-component sensor histidine kinase
MLKPQRTLLVVDDSPADRHIIKRYLHHDTEHRYLFVEAETGDQGLQRCSTSLPDCILIDYNLPDMNGLELLAELVSRSSPHLYPIVMMTGGGDEKVAVQAIQGGAQDYLVKGSLTWETLLIAVENAIGKVEMRRNLADQHQHLERQNAELQQKQNEIHALNVRLHRAMAESHHRIKNNLQILAAVVDVSMMDSPQMVPVGVLNRLGQHIQTLASLHDMLTIEAKNEAEMDIINVKIALERLAPMLQATSGGRRIELISEDVHLPLKQSSALLLLATELISNALKHGKGKVRLVLSLQDAWARLEVMDEGPGFPAGFDPQVASHTGMELVDSIGRHDLRGLVSYENRSNGGGRVVVVFPTQQNFQA